jgi:hypothetical protein
MHCEARPDVRWERTVILAVLGLATLRLAFGLMQEPSKKAVPPVQPLPFSHKQHVDIGLKCQECHNNPQPGDQMTLPATAKCMACHMVVAKDKPAIEKLAAFAKSNDPIPWLRVYKLPDWVWFSHRIHLEARAKCEACHGAIAQRDKLWREINLNMEGCMKCHREKGAALDCNACHESY